MFASFVWIISDPLAFLQDSQLLLDECPRFCSECACDKNAMDWTVPIRAKAIYVVRSVYLYLYLCMYIYIYIHTYESEM